MSFLGETIESAAQLPLKDAAFLFWIRRHELDYEEKHGSTWRDAGTAREGSTFRRLRTAYPQAGDRDLENAPEAAAKFAWDCEQSIAWSGSVDPALTVVAAVDLARPDNPGFTDFTIAEAIRHLVRLTR